MQSGCINHPSIESVGRCKQCGKPFCGTCELKGPTGRFCSEDCLKRHEVFVGRASKLDDMRGGSGFLSKLMNRLKKLLFYGAGALIILVVLHFIGVQVPVVSDFLNSL